MNLRIYITTLIIFLLSFTMPAIAESDKNDPEYQALREAMTKSFNAADSVNFFKAVHRFEDYLLSKNDIHGYYTQRCNEIVFLLNRQNVFEAYMRSIRLSQDLRSQHLDSEMYMAKNMMGHIYNYCGNTKEALRCFREVIEMQEKEGYTESMSAIYMNMVFILIDKDPDEADRLLDKAHELAHDSTRIVDINAYRTVIAFKRGNMEDFLKGYAEYKDAEKRGYSSVHAYSLDVYYLLSQKRIDDAINIAKTYLGSEGASLIRKIYESEGDWKNAYHYLKLDMQTTDSINAEILSNSVQGLQNELELFEADREVSSQRIISLAVISISMLVSALVLLFYSISRRKLIRELKVARDHALESDRMKSAFISNISHEIRTPLNIISGFVQVMSDSKNELTHEEQKNITHMMQHNTDLITTLVDELLDLSINDSTGKVQLSDTITCNDFCHEVIEANKKKANNNVTISLDSAVDNQYQLKTNRGFLRKILQALLDNACKYTEKGSVVLQVEHQASSIVFAVQDTGIGVPRSEAERIFERFEKLDTFKAGLGLGLSLARTLAQRMGGTLKLDTSYTAGARFMLELPLQ